MLSGIQTPARKALSIALAMFAVVWLNMALAPCLMAHEALAESSPPCPHCPPADDAPCHEAVATRCAFIGDFDHDGRFQPDPAGFEAVWLPLPGTVQPASALAAARLGLAPPGARDGPPIAPPLRHQYCVYLI